MFFFFPFTIILLNIYIDGVGIGVVVKRCWWYLARDRLTSRVNEVAFDNVAGAAELEPLVDHNGECDNEEKRDKNQNNDR